MEYTNNLCKATNFNVIIYFLKISLKENIFVLLGQCLRARYQAQHVQLSVRGKATLPQRPSAWARKSRSADRDLNSVIGCERKSRTPTHRRRRHHVVVAVSACARPTLRTSTRYRSVRRRRRRRSRRPFPSTARIQQAIFIPVARTHQRQSRAYIIYYYYHHPAHHW